MQRGVFVKQSNQVAVVDFKRLSLYRRFLHSVSLADINLSPGQALLLKLTVLAFLLVNEALKLL